MSENEAEQLIINCAWAVIAEWDTIEKDGVSLHEWLKAHPHPMASDIFNIPRVHTIIEEHLGDLAPRAAQLVALCLLNHANGYDMQGGIKLQ